MPSAESLAYHQLPRRGRSGWAWSLLGVVALGLLVVGGSQVVVLPVLLVATLAGLTVDIDPVTPAGLAWVNLVWAVAIPFAFLVAFLVHRLRPGWLGSVAGRIRWGWLTTSFGLAAVALAATLLVAAFLPAQGGTEMSGEVNDLTRSTVGFLLVILLLTPLQAAGEEYVFRGYLTQAFGSVLTGRAATAISIVVPAVLFALAHGAQDPPVFVDRLAFGLVAGALVVLTGGLEAAIAMHVLNNWVAFGLALTFGDINASLQPQASSWWSLPTTVTQSLVFLLLTVWLARRTGLATRTGQGVLEPPQGRV